MVWGLESWRAPVVVSVSDAVLLSQLAAFFIGDTNRLPTVETADSLMLPLGNVSKKHGC